MITFFVPILLELWMYGSSSDPGGFDFMLPVSGGTSTLSRRATLAARWLHQPISDQWMAVGFPHHAGRYRSGGSIFSSRGCWGCRCMEGLLNQGCDLVLPGCGGTSRLAREETLDAHWLYESQLRSAIIG